MLPLYLSSSIWRWSTPKNIFTHLLPQLSSHTSIHCICFYTDQSDILNIDKSHGYLTVSYFLKKKNWEPGFLLHSEGCSVIYSFLWVLSLGFYKFSPYTTPLTMPSQFSCDHAFSAHLFSMTARITRFLTRPSAPLAHTLLSLCNLSYS